MLIYVIVKGAHQEQGDFTLFTTEKSFSTKEAAEAHLKTLPIVWRETISGIPYSCERAIHPVELD